ncbi:MAG: prepilin-type N-terminal cleavage/methylation domain-containing protein [Opitutaceae bacterium]
MRPFLQSCRKLSARKREGFTLLEILVALALVGLVLVGLNTFLFSMGELWGKGSESRLFDQHVRAVSRFLERELRTAAWPPAVPAGTAGVSAKEVKAQSGISGQLLTFELREGSRLFSWPEHALPDVVCSLAVRDGAGLMLLWHSRIESHFEDDPPRETVVSPFVTTLQYEYYDPDFKSWRAESSLRRSREGGDSYDTPQRLRLTFKQGGMARDSTITIPAAAEGLPTF